MTIYSVSATLSANPLSLRAKSSAASVSCIEQGPTTTNRRGSLRSRISNIVCRAATTASRESPARGNSDFNCSGVMSASFEAMFRLSLCMGFTFRRPAIIANRCRLAMPLLIRVFQLPTENLETNSGHFNRSYRADKPKFRRWEHRGRERRVSARHPAQHSARPRLRVLSVVLFSAKRHTRYCLHAQDSQCCRRGVPQGLRKLPRSLFLRP